MDKIAYYVEEIEKMAKEMTGIEKWKSGHSQILIITGLMGSGKSTLAKDLAKKYNAKYFSLDTLINEFKKIHGSEKISLTKNKKYTTKLIIDYVLKESRGVPAILEGIQVPFLDFDLIKGFAFLTTDAGYIKSTGMAIKRDFSKAYFTKNKDKDFRFRPLNYVKGNLELNKHLKDFKSDLE